MGAAYDSYDYPAYWKEREYEHESEVFALRSFLAKIPRINKVIEIGGGYGRLTPTYLYRAKTATLTDPSAKLLSLARSQLKDYQNVRFTQTSLENLKNKFRGGSFDVALMIRVLHHLPDLEGTISSVEHILSQEGYFIFEFANKIHAKAILTHLLRRDFGFLNDTTPIDIRSKKSILAKTLPFLNYHPKTIKEILAKYNFEIIEKRSVSNIRNPLIKKHIPISLLLWAEKLLQRPLSYLNFGPSIFILAQKKG